MAGLGCPLRLVDIHDIAAGNAPIRSSITTHASWIRSLQVHNQPAMYQRKSAVNVQPVPAHLHANLNLVRQPDQNVDYLGHLVLPNVTEMRIVDASERVVVREIPDLPICSKLEIHGAALFENDFMIHRFATCLAHVSRLVITYPIKYSGREGQQRMEAWGRYMSATFPHRLAQLKSAEITPSVLNWLLGKSLVANVYDPPAAFCPAPQFTHLTLAPWTIDMPSFCHGLGDLQALESLIVHQTDADMALLNFKQIRQLSRLPRLEYLDAPVERPVRHHFSTSYVIGPTGERTEQNDDLD
ncbi:hypothetical protein GGF32_000870 [Allomyces javanicus]|nr:hypothetical protein GGF32_000870 [Allomyces javanicus]